MIFLPASSEGLDEVQTATWIYHLPPEGTSEWDREVHDALNKWRVPFSISLTVNLPLLILASWLNRRGTDGAEGIRRVRQPSHDACQGNRGAAQQTC